MSFKKIPKFFYQLCSKFFFRRVFLPPKKQAKIVEKENHFKGKLALFPVFTTHAAFTIYQCILIHEATSFGSRDFSCGFVGFCRQNENLKFCKN